MDFLRIQACCLCDEPMILNRRSPVDEEGRPVCVGCYTRSRLAALRSMEQKSIQPDGLDIFLAPPEGRTQFQNRPLS